MEVYGVSSFVQVLTIALLNMVTCICSYLRTHVLVRLPPLQVWAVPDLDWALGFGVWCVGFRGVEFRVRWGEGSGFTCRSPGVAGQCRALNASRLEEAKMCKVLDSGVSP